MGIRIFEFTTIYYFAMTDLAALTTLAQAATPGNWKQQVSNVTDRQGYMIASCYGAKHGSEASKCEANAAFIAACSPDTILGLVAKLREWEKEFEERGYAFQKAQNDTLLENRRLVERVRTMQTALERIANQTVDLNHRAIAKLALTPSEPQDG